MNQENADLIRLQQIARESRLSISREYSGLVSDLDFKKRFTESVKHHPYGWIGGAAAAGLLATILGGKGSSKPKVRVSPASTSAPQEKKEGSAISRAGWIAGALEIGKLLYPVLQPVVVDFVTKTAKAGLAKRLRP